MHCVYALCYRVQSELYMMYVVVYVVRCGGLYLENLSSCNLFCEVDTVTSFSPLHNSILEVRCVRRCT